MALITVKDRDSQHALPRVEAHGPIEKLNRESSIEEELLAIVQTVQLLSPDMPDVVMKTCMALMARCTELHLNLAKAELTDRKAKFDKSQLVKVMDLLDFNFKGASRLIEVHKIEVELSRGG